ncbi:MAG: hypothetical protein ABEJ03_00480 [Candidatus Nanohaloarchaea archaeon]
MDDEEAVESLSRARQEVRDAYMGWFAAELLYETSESKYFDRLVLGFKEEMRKTGEEHFYDAFRRLENELEAAEKAGYDTSGLEFDEEEADDILYNVQSVAFDRVGLSGLIVD